MIFINTVKMLDITSLYSFLDLHVSTISNCNKKWEIKDIIDIDDELLVFNPSLENLKTLIELKKEVNVIFSCINEEFLKLLENELVKKILIFDSLDKLFLDNNSIKKYYLINPLSECNKFEERKYNAVLCLNNIIDITDKDVDSIALLANYRKVFYAGYKLLNKSDDFNKLMNILYTNNIDVVEFPINKLKEDIATTKYTVFFTDNCYPIVSLYSARCCNLPFVFGKRYYSWLDSKLQNPSKELIRKIFTEKSLKDEILNHQKELLKEKFKNHQGIKEVLF